MERTLKRTTKPCLALLALLVSGLGTQAHAEAAQCIAAADSSGNGLWLAGLALMAAIALRRHGR